MLSLVSLSNVQSLSLLYAFDNIIKRWIRMNLKPGWTWFRIIFPVQILQCNLVGLIKINMNSSLFNFFLSVFVGESPIFNVVVFLSYFLLKMLVYEGEYLLTAFWVFETEIMDIVGDFIDSLFGFSFLFFFKERFLHDSKDMYFLFVLAVRPFLLGKGFCPWQMFFGDDDVVKLIVEI